MTKDEVIALVRAIGGSDRADPVCAQGDMITLDVDEVVRLVNIAAAQQAEQATQLNQSLGLYEQASEPVAMFHAHPADWQYNITSADVPRLTDDEHFELMRGQLKIHYGRAVEAEVRRRCGVVE